jgi:hypothetical protein
MVASKVRLTTRYVSISADVFLSPMGLMGGSVGWTNLTCDQFEYGGEKAVIADIVSLFGESNFTKPGILLANLQQGRVYAPLLQNYDGAIAVSFGDNLIPMVKQDGSLRLGDSIVTVQETTRTQKDEITGKEIEVPYVELVCELETKTERLKMKLGVKAIEGTDATLLADLLKGGDFEDALPLLSSPGKGGGLYPEASMLARGFALSWVDTLPVLTIPISGYKLDESHWKDPQTGRPIYSVKIDVASEYLPETMLIKYKDATTGIKRLFSLSKDQVKGLQFPDSSNAYRFFSGNSESELKALIAKGSLWLKVLAYGSKDKNHTPVHSIVKQVCIPLVDYSDLDLDALEEYPALPDKRGKTEAIPLVPDSAPRATSQAIPSANTALEDIEV